MLTVEGLAEGVVEGVKGFEYFYQQFDVLRIELTRHASTSVPYMRLSVERHEPYVPVEDHGEGGVLEHKILRELKSRFPGVDFKWGGGFDGGNPRGWDLWHGLALGSDEQARELQFGEDVVLFLYETGRVHPKMNVS